MKKGNTRHIRINDAIAHAIANVIRSELSDPRVGTIVSVTRAEVTTDLKLCDVYVSMGMTSNTDAGQQSEAVESLMAALVKARGFIRKRVAEIVNLRHTPEITFIYDDSIAHGMRMRALIEEANKQ